MIRTASQSRPDPLHAFIAGAFSGEDHRPVPLVKTAFDVGIGGGLATVVTRRTFRNAEDVTIEATFTFPVPVHAVLFDLAAKIDGRIVTAHAKRKVAARETYEDAIERGKTAVLHEEVLRGVHMLSLAHIAPGSDIEIVAGWVMPLAFVDGVGTLRIPLTVGDIYGRSGLPDSDDLVSGGPVEDGELTVTCGDGRVTLIGGRLENGRASVRLNRPIDLAVSGWTSRDREGRAADGRKVIVRMEPAGIGESPLDVAILVDHSGSMNEPCFAGDRSTKHQALSAGLRRLDDVLAGSDRIDLWTFNNRPTHIGTAAANALSRSFFDVRAASQAVARLVDRLNTPSGGTEIGIALDRVIAQSHARDLLLVTDGKSHALDVQSLARRGRRISVVLVGEDSLEAKVGHLAALTGGDIFVSSGSDVANSLAAALGGLRSPHVAAAPVSGPPTTIASRHSGMSLTATWTSDGEPAEPGMASRAVAAFAASLALPALDAEDAAALAEAEGLVTHLTSLVLVDENGRSQEGLPATRKVLLPMPQAAPPSPGSMRMLDARMLDADSAADEFGEPPVFRRGLAEFLSRRAPAAAPPPPDGDLRHWLDELARKVDWESAPARLRAGDLSELDEDTAQVIRAAAQRGDVIAAAKRLGLDPIVLVVGLAAHAAGRSRAAKRIAKAIFRDADQALVAMLLRTLAP